MSLDDDNKLHKHLDLTQELQSILGDDVVAYAYSTISGLEIRKGLDYNAQYSNFTLSTIEPSNPVIVKLKNGKLFQIWSSEWGGITKLEIEEGLTR